MFLFLVLRFSSKGHHEYNLGYSPNRATTENFHPVSEVTRLFALLSEVLHHVFSSS